MKDIIIIFYLFIYLFLHFIYLRYWELMTVVLKCFEWNYESNTLWNFNLNEWQLSYRASQNWTLLYMYCKNNLLRIFCVYFVWLLIQQCLRNYLIDQYRNLLVKIHKVSQNEWQNNRIIQRYIQRDIFKLNKLLT